MLTTVIHYKDLYILEDIHLLTNYTGTTLTSIRANPMGTPHVLPAWPEKRHRPAAALADSHKPHQISQNPSVLAMSLTRLIVTQVSV